MYWQMDLTYSWDYLLHRQLTDKKHQSWRCKAENKKLHFIILHIN